MYTLDDLTAADYAKILPGLKTQLDKVLGLPASVSMVQLDREDKIDADLLLFTTDGKIWYLQGNDLPSPWTTIEWVDFIVRLVRGPNTKELGTLREWPFTEIPIIMPWWNYTRVASVDNLAMLAGIMGGEPGVGPVAINWLLIGGLAGGGLLLYLLLRKRKK
jgi:hypothetical protein